MFMSLHCMHVALVFAQTATALCIHKVPLAITGCASAKLPLGGMLETNRTPKCGLHLNSHLSIYSQTNIIVI
jgi:hypothetical protein